MSVVSAGQSKIVTFVQGSPSENGPEAYDLDINPETSKITITAGSPAGAFYGVQSLISLVEGNDGNLVQMNIKDKPRLVSVVVYSLDKAKSTLRGI
jgi:N-acetyl-beta-hexosaminidase